MASKQVELSLLAYSKIILHAAKFPHCAVNGVLLAKKEDKESLKYVDVVPLLHSSLTLSPMMEIGLMQVEQFCKSHNLVIGGYYHANESFQESSLDFVAQRVAEKVAEQFVDACLLMVDNKSICLDMLSPGIHVFQHSEGKWKPKEKNNVTFESGQKKALRLVAALLQQKSYEDLVDFDSHLNDQSKDWTNKHFEGILEKTSALV
nr:EOG090X0C9C [Triops cancriformis]